MKTNKIKGKIVARWLQPDFIKYRSRTFNFYCPSPREKRLDTLKKLIRNNYNELRVNCYGGNAYSNFKWFIKRGYVKLKVNHMGMCYSNSYAELTSKGRKLAKKLL